jgi:hypothetical protein
MAITVTWQETGADPYVFEVPAEVADAMEQMRIADQVAIPRSIPTRQMNPLTGVVETVEVQVPDARPRYASVRELVVGFFVEKLVTPVLEQYPPAEVAARKAEADLALARVEEARRAALQSLLGA